MKTITNVKRACTTVNLIGISLLLLAGTPSSQAAEIKIVSPSSYVNKEGEGCYCSASEPPYRYQQVFPAADFAALGNQPHWLVGFGPRADQSVTSPHTAYLPDNYVRLSTTGRAPNNLSVSFDANPRFGRHGVLQRAADHGGGCCWPRPRSEGILSCRLSCRRDSFSL